MACIFDSSKKIEDTLEENLLTNKKNKTIIRTVTLRKYFNSKSNNGQTEILQKKGGSHQGQ